MEDKKKTLDQVTHISEIETDKTKSDEVITEITDEAFCEAFKFDLDNWEIPDYPATDTITDINEFVSNNRGN